MALVPHVYLDVGLTDQFDDATDILGASAINGGQGDGVFYVGSPDDTIKIQADSDPGIDPITVSIADSAPGSGVEVTDIKLALTQGGLGGTTGGASLNLGATINGGVANAVAVWYRWTNGTGGDTYTEISLGIVARAESAI